MNEAQGGFAALFQSRRFIVAVIDVITALLLYFVGKYYSVALDDLKFVILTIQPVVIMVIIAFTIDDSQQASLANQLRMHQMSLESQQQQFQSLSKSSVK